MTSKMSQTSEQMNEEEQNGWLTGMSQTVCFITLKTVYLLGIGLQHNQNLITLSFLHI